MRRPRATTHHTSRLWTPLACTPNSLPYMRRQTSGGHSIAGPSLPNYAPRPPNLYPFRFCSSREITSQLGNQKWPSPSLVSPEALASLPCSERLFSQRHSLDQAPADASNVFRVVTLGPPCVLNPGLRGLVRPRHRPKALDRCPGLNPSGPAAPGSWTTE